MREKRFAKGDVRFGAARENLNYKFAFELWKVCFQPTYGEVIDWATNNGYEESITYDSIQHEWIIMDQGDYYLWGAVFYTGDEDILLECNLRFA